jgi:hypothetical protein
MAGGLDDGDGTDLDAMLRAARAEPVPDALMARVLADAAQVQAGFAAAPVPARPAMRPRVAVPRPGPLRRLVRAAGGGAACAGLATAALAGLWVGLAQPAILSPVSLHLWPDAAAESVDLIPSFDEVLGYAEG